MLNVQTINCMQYSETVVIQTRSQSHKEINAHTEHLQYSSKTQLTISFNWKEAIWSLTKNKENKETRKKS